MMIDADKIYKTIALKNESSSEDSLLTAASLSQIFKSTPHSDIDKLWGKIEKEFNGKKPFKLKAKTDEEKMQTAFGLLYNVLNKIDANAKSTYEINAFREIYLETKNYVENRYLTRLSGKDKRNLSRAINVTGGRLTNVIERYNELVANQQIAGPNL